MDNKQIQIKVWIKSDCPFCIKAREELLLKQVNHAVYVMDDALDELQSVQDTWQHTTVPVVVLNENSTENLIGGYTELKKWLDERPTVD